MDDGVQMKFRDREFSIPSGITVREAILAVGLAPETILAVRNGRLVPDDAVLQPGETLKLVQIISGG